MKPAIHLVGGAAADAPVPPRSPERRTLAAAIERFSAAQRALDRIAEARNKIGERWSMDNAVDRAEEALSKAREGEAATALAEILGEDLPAGKSVAETEAALRVAQEEAARRRRLHGLLDEEEHVVRDELEWATRIRREAVLAAIRVDPATIALLESYDAARQRVAELERQLSAIASALPQFWMGQRNWPDLGSARPWHAAIDTLLIDPDAVLPAVDNAPEPPRAA